MLQFNFFYLYCTQNLKANHNKDYSVVKTFRAAPSLGSFSFFAPVRRFCPKFRAFFLCRPPFASRRICYFFRRETGPCALFLNDS